MIKTKYGTAYLRNDGYYGISSNEKGNTGQLLHRLIWEEHYQKSIPKDYVIHHINFNKKDNRIQNLQCVHKNTHLQFHNKMMDRNGENNSMFGKKHSDETRAKMSNARKGKKFTKEHRKNLSESLKGKNCGKTHSDETKIELSKKKSTTGYFRVTKHKNKTSKQGFDWCYRYYEKGKRKYIRRVNLDDLEKEVKDRNLIWLKFDNGNGD